MLYLMNKNRIVAEIGEKEGILDTSYSVERPFARMPYKSEEINGWLEARKASKHNARLKQLMKDCGCGTTEGYIRITHAATLNDTFWVRAENENVTWSRFRYTEINSIKWFRS